MASHQTVTPVSSQGTTSNPPLYQAGNGGTINQKPQQSAVKPPPNQHGLLKFMPPKPLFSQLDRRFQLKLLDVCTEYQGVYYITENLDGFWNLIAKALCKDVRIPLVGKDVETWVEGICREAKDYLLRGETIPQRPDRQDLDIAIEDWLEIEGRRKIQKAASELKIGYILAFGPERPEDEDLITGPCLHRLRDNADKIKTAVSEKGKASQKTSILLVRKIESLTPKVVQKPLTAGQSSDIGGGSSPGTGQAKNPNPQSNTPTNHNTHRTSIDNISAGPSSVGGNVSPELFRLSSETPDTSMNSRYSSAGLYSSPARGPSPSLGALDSPIRNPPEPTRDEATETQIAQPITEPAHDDLDERLQKHYDAIAKLQQPCCPSDRCILPLDTTNPKKSLTPVVHREPIRTRSSTRNSRINGRETSSQDTEEVGSNLGEQEQQQQVESDSEMRDNPDHEEHEEQDKYLTVAPPKKGRNKRSRSTHPTLSAPKVHRTRYTMSSPLRASRRSPERTSPDDDDDDDDDEAADDAEDDGYQAPNTPPPQENLPEPQMSPPNLPASPENHSQSSPATPAATAPSTPSPHHPPSHSSPPNNPTRIVPIPLIDLTQSPVKKEEDQDGPVFSNLSNQLISQLTTNLHGAVGLTEHIKEIVGRTVSHSLEEFELRTLGRLEEMNRRFEEGRR